MSVYVYICMHIHVCTFVYVHVHSGTRHNSMWCSSIWYQWYCVVSGGIPTKCIIMGKSINHCKNGNNVTCVAERVYSNLFSKNT